MEGNVEEMMKVTGRQTRCKQILCHLREMKLKVETLDCTVWRKRFLMRLWTCGKAEHRMNEV
jgi:hypothetical protein